MNFIPNFKKSNFLSSKNISTQMREGYVRFGWRGFSKLLRSAHTICGKMYAQNGRTTVSRNHASQIEHTYHTYAARCPVKGDKRIQNQNKKEAKRSRSGDSELKISVNFLKFSK